MSFAGSRIGTPVFGFEAGVVVLVRVVADELALVDHQVRLPQGIDLLVRVRGGDVLPHRARAAALPAAGRDDVDDPPGPASVGAGVQGDGQVRAVTVVRRRPVRVGRLVLRAVVVVARHDAREEQRALLQVPYVLREHVEVRVRPVARVLRVPGIAGEIRRGLDLRQRLPRRAALHGSAGYPGAAPDNGGHRARNGGHRARRTSGPTPQGPTRTSGSDYVGGDQTRSNRSRSETLTHAATKSFTNFSLASSLA